MISSIFIPSRAPRLPGQAVKTMTASAVTLCVAWLRNRLRIRRSAEALTALDDHLLADLGISRDQIRHIARIGRLPG